MGPGGGRPGHGQRAAPDVLPAQGKLVAALHLAADGVCDLFLLRPPAQPVAIVPQETAAAGRGVRMTMRKPGNQELHWKPGCFMDSWLRN